jgi:hypothetical protein
MKVGVLPLEQVGKPLLNRAMQAADGVVVVGTGHRAEASPENHRMI